MAAAMLLVAPLVKAETSNVCLGFGCYELRFAQVLGDTVFAPCPSGQVYLCSGGVNPSSGMTCADGSQPTCQTQPNYQPQQNPGQPGPMMGQSQPPAPSQPQPYQGYQPQQGPMMGPNQQPGQGEPYQGRQPQQGPMMGPNQNQGNFQQGPSQEEMDKQQKQRDEQQLKNMKRDVGRITQGLKPAKNLITKAQKLGLTVPQTLIDAVAGVENYANTVKNAADMTAIENLDANPGDYFSEISDSMGLLSRQIELNQRILPQLTKSTKPFQNAYNRLAKNKSIDSAILDSFKASLDEVNAYIAQIQAAAKSAATTDELDNVFTMLDELPDKFNNLGTEQQQAEFFANYKKGITSFTSTINKFTSAINRADKQKLDTASAKEQLAQIKQQFDEVKTAANTKPVDIEDLMNKVDNLANLVDELNTALNDLGVGVNIVAIPQVQQQPQSNFQMPSSFNQPQMQQGQGPQMAPGTF